MEAAISSGQYMNTTISKVKTGGTRICQEKYVSMIGLQQSGL